jgi:hypothetical protein
MIHTYYELLFLEQTRDLSAERSERDIVQALV